MYRVASILTAIICAGLFLIFLLLPNFYVEIYGVAGDRGADFVGRRASAMFLGLAVVLWLTRKERPSPLRAVICYSVAAVFAGIAFTGLFEFGRGNANLNIVAAAFGEMLIAFVYMVLARR